MSFYWGRCFLHLIPASSAFTANFCLLEPLTALLQDEVAVKSQIQA